VLVLSTGVIGVPLPMDALLPGSRSRGALSARRRRRRGAGDPHDRHVHEGSASHGDGFTVGGMAKGSGMIHPNLATMLAVVTTDYPLEPGEPLDFLRPAVDESFNSISVDGECSTNDAVVLLSSGARRAHAATTRVRRRAAAGLRRPRAQIVADGEGATLVAEITSPAPRRRRGEGRRAPDRDVAARQDRALRQGRELGPRPRRRRLGAVQRRLRAARPEPRDTALQRHDGARRGAPQGVEPDVAARAARSTSTSARRRQRAVPDDRPVLRLRPHQRGLPLVTRRSSSSAAARSPRARRS
jgi:hypothetical protein